MNAHLLLLLITLGAGSAFAAATEIPPNLLEAFGRPIAGAGGVASGSDLFRIDVPAAGYPFAHCADGTPAVFYVRRAAAAEHRDQWVIYLQGGGSCDSGQDCYERWLGRDGNFGGNKLSSRFAPPRGIAGGGIESTLAANPFAAWNHVFLYYCSSDTWIGERAGLTTSAVHNGLAVAYRIDFLGGYIVDAVLDLLRGTAGPLRYRGADGSLREMPDLDAATAVLFSGSSAGGNGARSNADRVAARLRENNLRCSPESCPLVFAAVVDASYGLATEALDYHDTAICGAERIGSCSYALAMQRRWSTVLRDFWGARSDASCVAYHAAAGDEWRCADGAHVLQHHLLSPFFVRSDLQDPLLMGNLIEAGFAFEGLPIDLALYGALEEIQLLELASLGERAEEPRLASPLEPPGVFGPQCGDHEALRSDSGSFRRRIEDASGVPHSLLEVLHNWLTDRPFGALIEHFDPAGPPSSCRG